MPPIDHVLLGSLGHVLPFGTPRSFCCSKRSICADRAEGEDELLPVHVTWVVGNCPLKLKRTTNRQVSLENGTAATEAWRTRCFLLLPARVQGFVVASAPCSGTYTQRVPALGPCQAVAAYSIRLPACVHCPLAPCPMHAVVVVRAPAECETDCCLVAP